MQPRPYTTEHFFFQLSKGPHDLEFMLWRGTAVEPTGSQLLWHIQQGFLLLLEQKLRIARDSEKTETSQLV